MARPRYFDARSASFRAMAPALDGFHGLAFLRGGITASAPRSATASWHLRVVRGGLETRRWGLLKNPDQVVPNDWIARFAMTFRMYENRSDASFLRFMAMAVSRAWTFMFVSPRRMALFSPCSVLAVPCAPSTRHRCRV